MADKHIKIDSQFNAVSAFWKPETPEDISTGTLTVDEQSITFTTAPEYKTKNSVGGISSLRHLSEKGERLKIPALHGFTENGVCTLCKLFEINSPSLIDYRSEQSIKAMSYNASFCIMGMHLGGLDDKSLNSARFTFTGLSEWLPKASDEQWEKDYVVLKVHLVEREIVSFLLRDSQVRVSLKIFPELTSSAVDGARLIQSVAYVEIATPNSECLSWYLRIGNRLENLFSLLIGTSQGIETVFVYRGEECGTVFGKRNSDVKPFELLDCVRCTSNQLKNSIEIWLLESDQFQSVEDVALGVGRKGKLFIETQFLSMAQALEGFHRVTAHEATLDKATFRQVRNKISTLLKDEPLDESLKKRICDSLAHVNEPTFASRLKELCNRVSSVLLLRMGIEVEEFVAAIVATRNFYTHAGGRTKKQKRILVSGPELLFLNQRMRALLRGVMLLHLGIPEEQFSEQLAREATRWG